jgi:hypothetical protein
VEERDYMEGIIPEVDANELVAKENTKAEDIVDFDEI